MELSDVPLKSGNSGSKVTSHLQGVSMLEAELLLHPVQKDLNTKVGVAPRIWRTVFPAFFEIC